MDTISIDDDFVRVGGKSYAINKINSVEVRAGKPRGRSSAVVLGALAVFAVTGFFGSIASGEGVKPGWLAFAAICGALAYRDWQRAHIRDYQLFLMTSSQEAQALKSQDGEHIADLRSQIEMAMQRSARSARV